MTSGKNRGRAVAAALAVALCGTEMTPALAQTQQAGFTAIINAARARIRDALASIPVRRRAASR